MGGCCGRASPEPKLPAVTIPLTAIAAAENATDKDKAKQAEWAAAWAEEASAGPFAPNFLFQNEVTLKQTTPERVMQLLFASDRARDVVSLSTLCVSCTVLATSTASAAGEPDLKQAESGSGSGSGGGGGGGGGGGKSIPAVGGCGLVFVERVPVMCAITTDVILNVRQQYDMTRGELNYQSRSNTGIRVRKRRVVKAGGNPGEVVVSEWVEGQANCCFAGIAQEKGNQSHIEHIGKYTTLIASQ